MIILNVCCICDFFFFFFGDLFALKYDCYVRFVEFVVRIQSSMGQAKMLDQKT